MTLTQLRPEGLTTGLRLPFTSSYAIETVGLSKHYGEVRAVEGLDLRVEPGQIYGLLGPNGAGKTTTINMLTTLIPPGGGRASVAGYDVALQPALVRRHIGVTFQETVLDRNLTGRLLLQVHGRLYKLSGPQIKARIAELAALVELEDVLDRTVRTYSGGMKRRLELARGLMTSPRVLFLDEPTVGLDPHNRDRIWTYIQRLKAEQGLTILLTTHYMDEAAHLADRVGIIDEGRLVVEGQPNNLIESLGADVVSVTGQGEPTQFMAALEQQEWVLFASLPQAEAEPGSSAVNSAPNPTERATESKSEIESNCETDSEATSLLKTVQVGLKTEAGRSLKPIIELAEQNGFAVADVSLKRPELSDVFFKYTGRRLRD